MSDFTNILSLPSELLSIILRNYEISVRDVLNFGVTCVTFNNYVKSDETLWRCKIYQLLPLNIYNLIGTQCDGKWMNEVQKFYQLKNNIYTEIMAMSSKFFRTVNDLHYEDIIVFMNLALSRNVNYLLSIWILCDLLAKGNRQLQKLIGIKPYTLTDMYYARIVLQYLFHTYLMIKFSLKYYLKQMTPESVVNFFVQWIDTSNLHMEEEIEATIDNLVDQVEKLLTKSHPLKSTPHDVRKQWSSNLLSNNMWNMAECQQVLTAVAHVTRMTVTAEATMDTLDVIKVMNTKFGSPITIASVYEAIARRCGVRCEVIVFPNHLYMEWRESYAESEMSPPYKVNYISGQLERRQTCPFAGGPPRDSRAFCPDSFLKYICAAYTRSMGAIRNSSIRNVNYLLAFMVMAADQDQNGLYKNYRRFLFQVISADPTILSTHLSLKNLDDIYIKVIKSMITLNTYELIPPRAVAVRRRGSEVQFGVGMVCYHVRYQYVCVVVGWDAECAASAEWQDQMAVRGLDLGARQPFYNVLAADCSERYVAQENLRDIPKTTRIYHLEELIARDFSHYDGFCYVPNEEKEAEYPDDGSVRDFYCSRALFNHHQTNITRPPIPSSWNRNSAL